MVIERRLVMMVKGSVDEDAGEEEGEGIGGGGNDGRSGQGLVQRVILQKGYWC